MTPIIIIIILIIIIIPIKMVTLPRAPMDNKSIGALGSVTKGFNRWIEKLGITLNVGVMQKAALLGTARILRKVLEM